jgi:hypothetical protein
MKWSEIAAKLPTTETFVKVLRIPDLLPIVFNYANLFLCNVCNQVVTYPILNTLNRKLPGAVIKKRTGEPFVEVFPGVMWNWTECKSRLETVSRFCSGKFTVQCGACSGLASLQSLTKEYLEDPMRLALSSLSSSHQESDKEELKQKEKLILLETIPENQKILERVSKRWCDCGVLIPNKKRKKFSCGECQRGKCVKCKKTCCS